MNPRERGILRGIRAQVFVAACSGSAKLSEAIGLPLVHVDATTDAIASVRRLNERQHASGVRVPEMFQPILFDGGWSDWDVVDCRPGPWRRGMALLPDGVRTVAGRLEVDLPPTVTLAEFREELQAGLRHLRLQEVTSEMSYMEARNDALLPYLVQPRYAPNPVDRGFRRARRVDDLYVYDPAESPWALYWIAVAARAAFAEACA